MIIGQLIENIIRRSLEVVGPEAKEIEIKLEHPTLVSHGDYSTNVALAAAKVLNRKPIELAVELVGEISQNLPVEVERVEVAGPGFINFHLSKKYFTEAVKKINADGESFGKTTLLEGKKVVIDYTDPNPFKQFHIGHLMSNAIGEALSRIIEWNGAKVARVCYQGDVGRHVALTIWGIRKMDEDFPSESESLEKRIEYLGKAYAKGATHLKEHPEIISEIQLLNKKIYERNDEEVNELYNKGREWSLQHFEELYKKLGTNFDQYIFESVTAPMGLEIVNSNVGKVFEESDGAIVFKGEDHGLHTRVFVTKEGLPTYEAKDLGLAKVKHDHFPFDESIIITASEQSEYFKVMIKALSFIYPEIAETMRHVSHGMLRLPSGKMSSRTGDVITGESLINDAEKKVEDKIKDREYDEETKKDIIEKVAVAAIKYSILKQSPGKDIIFDMETALSFEGDSGPYLQYSYVRANSVIKKAGDLEEGETKEQAIDLLEKLLPRLPEIVELSVKESAPQYIATYLIELAGAFNSYYAHNKILESGEESAYRLSVTKAFSHVLKNGLNILGIPVPEKM
jgi:arginyl-tRNA synthetase